MLLLIAVVFTGASHFLQEHRSRHCLTCIEGHGGEAVALQPNGLLATVFFDVVLSERVVRCERQAIGRRKLCSELSIAALALLIRERITNVVRNAVQLASSWGIRDMRACSDGSRSRVAP